MQQALRMCDGRMRRVTRKTRARQLVELQQRGLHDMGITGKPRRAVQVEQCAAEQRWNAGDIRSREIRMCHVDMRVQWRGGVRMQLVHHALQQRQRGIVALFAVQQQATAR